MTCRIAMWSRIRNFSSRFSRPWASGFVSPASGGTSSRRSREYICEETGEEVVLMKDASGRFIGFEKLNFSIPQSDSLRVALETVPA